MDDARLRAVANTRPGFATYPNTRPGSPSWWSRPGEECVLVIRPGLGMLCVHTDHQHPQTWPAPAVPAARPSAPITGQLAEHPATAAAATPTRRRWWHRIAWRAHR